MIRCRLILSVSVLLIGLAASSACAQMLSLFADESQTSYEIGLIDPYVPNTPFNVYVFLEPGPDGAYAVEYKLTIPPSHIMSSLEISPVVAAHTIGVWYGSPGISAPFLSCQNDLFWVCRLTMTSPDTVPGYYSIWKNDDSDFMGIAICSNPRPLVDALVYNNLCFIMSCCGATEESSWGAIKGMYR